MDKKNQEDKELDATDATNTNKTKNNTIHLDHAPEPHGRDGGQFDSDLEDLT